MPVSEAFPSRFSFSSRCETCWPGPGSPRRQLRVRFAADRRSFPRHTAGDHRLPGNYPHGGLAVEVAWGLWYEGCGL